MKVTAKGSDIERYFNVKYKVNRVDGKLVGGYIILNAKMIIR